MHNQNFLNKDFQPKGAYRLMHNQNFLNKDFQPKGAYRLIHNQEFFNKDLQPISSIIDTFELEHSSLHQSNGAYKVNAQPEFFN